MMYDHTYKLAKIKKIDYFTFSCTAVTDFKQFCKKKNIK